MEAFTAQYAFIDYLGSSVERLTADLCEYWLEKSAGLQWDSLLLCNCAQTDKHASMFQKLIYTSKSELFGF